MTTRPIQYQSSATWLSLWCQSNQTMPPRLLYCQWIITQPIQYNTSATGLCLCFQLDNRTPLRIFNYHWNTSPHKVTVMQIKSHNPTQITLIPMNDHSDYFTTNEWPLNHSSTNPVPLDCHCNANKPHNSTYITVLPMNDHSTTPIQILCHLTVTVMPIRPKMPLRLLYCQLMTTQLIQYQSSATWLSLCCQSDKTMPLRLLYCQWMANRPI